MKRLIVFFAKLPSGSRITLNCIKAFVTGFVVEIGLKVLNRSSGPAIRRMMPSYPQPPRPILKYQGT